MVHCCQGQFWSNILAMSDQAFHQFKLRLPADLFQRLEAEAAAANRSVSAEMIHRLERSFEPVQSGSDADEDLLVKFQRLVNPALIEMTKIENEARKLMAERGLTQKEVAALMGLKFDADSVRKAAVKRMKKKSA